MKAQEVKVAVLSALSICGSGLAYLLGGWDTAVQSLIIIMAIDYVTGVMIAAFWNSSNKTETGGLDSKAGFKGLAKKVTILLAVLLGVTLDRAIGTDAFARTAIILFFTANEGLSVVENLAIMGVPFPEKVKRTLEQLNTKEKAEY